MGLTGALERFNARHPWSHNDAFAGFVLRQAGAVRRGGGSAAVDVGCGTGNLVGRLAHVFPTVIGVEPDPETALIAERRFARVPQVRIDRRPFGEGELPDADLVVFVASLHHMPLREALLRARRMLRPGGRIVVVGVARETSRDVARSLLSAVLNPLVGFARHPRRASVAPTQMRAPATDADESFDEIREVARDVLPGVRMRRRLFWRYTAVWVA